MALIFNLLPVLFIYRSISLFIDVYFLKQEIVPAHLATSPIPTEESLIRSRDSRCERSSAGIGQPNDTADPASGDLHVCSGTTGKKKKRRRRKHKTDPRKEEQTCAVVEPDENSSDEDPHVVGR